VNNSVDAILGSQIDNPATTFQGSIFEISFSINEDGTGNTIHFLLLVLALLILPWLKTDDKPDRYAFILVIFLSLILYSLAFKWQPWGGRLQTPIFLLGCVATGLLIDKIFKKELFSVGMLIIFLFTSTPYLLLNSNRPLLPLWEDNSVFYDTELERKIYSSLGNKLDNFPTLENKLTSMLSLFYEGRSVVLTERRELYFLGNFEPYYWYNEACHFVRNDPSRNIGLLMDSNDWEYPLWVLLGQHASPGKWQIDHIDVQDISGTLSHQGTPLPELLLITRDDYQDLAFLSNYEQVYSSVSIQVMKRID